MEFDVFVFFKIFFLQFEENLVVLVGVENFFFVIATVVYVVVRIGQEYTSFVFSFFLLHIDIMKGEN